MLDKIALVVILVDFHGSQTGLMECYPKPFRVIAKTVRLRGTGGRAGGGRVGRRRVLLVMMVIALAHIFFWAKQAGEHVGVRSSRARQYRVQ